MLACMPRSGCLRHLAGGHQITSSQLWRGQQHVRLAFQQPSGQMRSIVLFADASWERGISSPAITAASARPVFVLPARLAGLSLGGRLTAFAHLASQAFANQHLHYQCQIRHRSWQMASATGGGALKLCGSPGSQIEHWSCSWGGRRLPIVTCVATCWAKGGSIPVTTVVFANRVFAPLAHQAVYKSRGLPLPEA